MDRKYAQNPIDRHSMQTHRGASFELLLRGTHAKRFSSYAHEASRRDLHGEAVLWVSEDFTGVTQRRTQCQSKTSPENHAELGVSWQSTWPKYVKEPSRARQISISLARSRNSMSTPRLEHRHHVHSAAERLRVSGCCHRLVQSASAFLPPFKQPGDHFLCRCLRGGDRDLWSTKNLQYRPGRSVYIPRICECCTRQKHSFQHGWAWAGPRQHFCGAFMEIREV